MVTALSDSLDAGYIHVVLLSQSCIGGERYAVPDLHVPIHCCTADLGENCIVQQWWSIALIESIQGMYLYKGRLR